MGPMHRPQPRRFTQPCRICGRKTGLAWMWLLAPPSKTKPLWGEAGGTIREHWFGMKPRATGQGRSGHRPREGQATGQGYARGRTPGAATTTRTGFFFFGACYGCNIWCFDVCTCSGPRLASCLRNHAWALSLNGNILAAAPYSLLPLLPTHYYYCSCSLLP